MAAGLDAAMTAEAECAAGIEPAAPADADAKGESSFVRHIFSIGIEQRMACVECGYIDPPRQHEAWAEYVYADELMESVDENGAFASSVRRRAPL